MHEEYWKRTIMKQLPDNMDIMIIGGSAEDNGERRGMVQEDGESWERVGGRRGWISAICM